jgi:hypothetical protein
MRAAIAAASMLLVILSGTARADVKITSAAMREQSGSDAAAAVFMLTREDIRRNGATSIPENVDLSP